MSEPKRFNFSATIVHHIGEEKTAALKYHTEPDGLFVSYEDYARLKAENARLKTEVEHLMVFCNCTLIPNKELQAQVERLTKAGDAMVGLLEHMDVIVDMDSDHPEVEAWNAAKEGKGQP
jgi:hypothetical protein